MVAKLFACYLYVPILSPLKKLLLFITLILSLQSYAQLVFPYLSVEYDSVWAYKDLQLIPIRYVPQPGEVKTISKRFMTLEEGLQMKKVQVKEYFYKGDADVHVLSIRNNSKMDVLVQSGELLEGGKQDRMIAETKIIPAGKQEEYLSVFCMEKGRWNGAPKPFAYAGMGDAEVRKSVDSSGLQQHVWKQIDQQYADSSKTSETWSYMELHKNDWKKDKDYVDYFFQRFAASDSNYAGFIAITHNKIIGAELFANNQLTIAAYKNLVTSYVRSIKHVASPVFPSQEVHVFARELMGDDASQKKYLAHHGKLFGDPKKPLHIVAYGHK